MHDCSALWVASTCGGTIVVSPLRGDISIYSFVCFFTHFCGILYIDNKRNPLLCAAAMWSARRLRLSQSLLVQQPTWWMKQTCVTTAVNLPSFIQRSECRRSDEHSLLLSPTESLFMHLYAQETVNILIGSLNVAQQLTKKHNNRKHPVISWSREAAGRRLAAGQSPYEVYLKLNEVSHAATGFCCSLLLSEMWQIAFWPWITGRKRWRDASHTSPSCNGGSLYNHEHRTAAFSAYKDQSLDPDPGENLREDRLKRVWHHFLKGLRAVNIGFISG